MKEKALTKWSVCTRVMKQVLKFTLVFWMILTVILIANSIGSLTMVLFVKIIITTLSLALTSTIAILLPFTFMVIRYFLNIRRQEQYFRFKLSDEMKKENITKIPYKSKIWYINGDFPMIIAVRKDYIQCIKNVKYSTTYMRGSPRSSGKVTLITIDGKKIKYHGSGIVIREFVKWLSFQSHLK